MRQPKAIKGISEPVIWICLTLILTIIVWFLDWDFMFSNKYTSIAENPYYIFQFACYTIAAVSLFCNGFKIWAAYYEAYCK